MRQESEIVSVIRRLFENENWLVVVKPAGWLTTPARAKEDPRPCLGRSLQAEVGQQIFPVHRLDFEVSGLVLFAKNAMAHRIGQKWFEKGEILKTYRAETGPALGEWGEEWMEWRSKLLRGKRRAYVSANGKESLTRARIVGKSDLVWVWELQPLTGRPHQLRVELANHGAAILGDELYGGKKGAPHAIALKAVRLDFENINAAERLGLPSVITLD